MSIEKYEITYQELTDLINRNADKMTALEVLAIAANMVGKLIALQDQRTVSVDKAMYIVQINMELGNQQVIAALFNNTEGNA